MFIFEKGIKGPAMPSSRMVLLAAVAASLTHHATADPATAHAGAGAGTSATMPLLGVGDALALSKATDNKVYRRRQERRDAKDDAEEGGAAGMGMGHDKGNSEETPAPPPPAMGVKVGKGKKGKVGKGKKEFDAKQMGYKLSSSTMTYWETTSTTPPPVVPDGALEQPGSSTTTTTPAPLLARQGVGERFGYDEDGQDDSTTTISNVRQTRQTSTETPPPCDGVDATVHCNGFGSLLARDGECRCKCDEGHTGAACEKTPCTGKDSKDFCSGFGTLLVKGRTCGCVSPHPLYFKKKNTTRVDELCICVCLVVPT